MEPVRSFSMRRSTSARSARMSSVSRVAMSSIGSIAPVSVVPARGEYRMVREVEVDVRFEPDPGEEGISVADLHEKSGLRFVRAPAL